MKRCLAIVPLLFVAVLVDACSKKNDIQTGGPVEDPCAICDTADYPFTCPNDPTDCRSFCQYEADQSKEACYDLLEAVNNCVFGSPSSDFSCSTGGTTKYDDTLCKD